MVPGKHVGVVAAEEACTCEGEGGVGTLPKWVFGSFDGDWEAIVFEEASAAGCQADVMVLGERGRVGVGLGRGTECILVMR